MNFLYKSETGHILFLRILYPIHIQAQKKDIISYHYHSKKRKCIYILYLVSYILYPISYILYPISYILYPISYILYHISYILHPISYILYPISYILYPISYIIYPISYILYPISYILYPISYYILLYPISYILYPISFVKMFPRIVTGSEQWKARPGSTAAHQSSTFYNIEFKPWSISRGAARKWQISAEMAEMAVLKEKSCLWNPKSQALNVKKKDIG
jgi:hypothetical protein